MNRLRYVIPIIVATVFAIAICGPVSCVGVKYKTSGTYVDSAGGQHAWSVNDAHTLIWDSQPYVPVGGVLVSRYISFGSEDDYQADVAAIQAAASRGITDIIIKASGPATLSDPAAWQRIIDYLDSQGMNYGIELSDGPKDPLKGHIVSPSRYRLEGPSESTTINCDWPGVDSAIYVIVNKTTNQISTTGGAFVKDGKVSIKLPQPLSQNDILIVYPRRAFGALGDGGYGDIWTGFGEYRDRVLAFFKQIKLGPGMRFFLEPFTCKMDFTGEMVGFVPDSQGFRLGLEAYLTRKYVHEGTVNAKWGLNENLDSIEIAARLLPLWSMGRGATSAYDRAAGTTFPVDATVSQMWRDITDYRDTSTQEYMNTISDTLRKQVANVPVIFKNTKYHRIYANPYGMGGYDGLGVQAYGTGDAPVEDVGGPAYSLAEESGKSTWFIVAGTAAAAPTASSAGYPSERVLTSTLDSFREVGCKGFFVDGLGSDANQLDWLKTFKGSLKPEKLLSYKPDVINYPLAPATGAHCRRLAPNTWWLPTLRMGTSSYIGDGLSAYALAGEDRTYIWSSTGPKTVTLKAGPTGYPTAEFPRDSGMSKGKDNQFTLKLTDVPTVLRGMDIQLVFPYETAFTEIDRLAALVPVADKAGLGTKQARDMIDKARNVAKKGLPSTAYGMAQQGLMELLTALGPDVWLEGESSPANNFDGPYPAYGASNNLALTLNTPDDPPLGAYTAMFLFDAPSNSSYELWVAATPPADASPMSYNVEESGWVPVAAQGPADGGSGPAVHPYAKDLAWYRLGTVNLAPGRHTIKFRADGKRATDGRYCFAIDALVLSPRGFTPNGVIKPF